MKIIKSTYNAEKQAPPSSRVPVDTPEDLFEGHCNFLAIYMYMYRQSS